MNRDEYVQIRVSKTEANRWKLRAKQSGVTLSAWLRALANRAGDRPPVLAATPSLGRKRRA